jgi:hypothetical protein
VYVSGGKIYLLTDTEIYSVSQLAGISKQVAKFYFWIWGCVPCAGRQERYLLGFPGSPKGRIVLQYQFHIGFIILLRHLGLSQKG